MKNHFIKNIQIKDFKCFDDFKAEGFSRVNLIGGKNNVGKTAFLEASYINVSSNDFWFFSGSLISIKAMRESLNILHAILLNDSFKIDKRKFLEQCNAVLIKTNVNKVSFEIDEYDGVVYYNFDLQKTGITKVKAKDFTCELEYYEGCQFIDNFGLSNINIKNNYSYIQKKDAEKYIDNILHEFDSSITTLKIIDEVPQCKYDGEYLPLTELGDGLRHLVSILVSLYSSEEGYLFIDEVDNGIHYTMLDDIWDMILTLSKKLNVQVFATTHSKECIESFNRAQLKLEDMQSSYFELAKEKETSKIFMRGLDSEQLEYELSHQGRYRGE